MSETLPGFVETIIREAEELAHKKEPTYQDYEFFKHKLHASGFYGYEKSIANALGI